MSMRKVVPRPRWVAMSMTPPSFVTFTSATSMPTPRPEVSVTRSAVEKPGEKMKWAI
jgi:hypothetical protein